VNPELKYREEIPSGFNLWLEMQWFGQFEPEKIIAVTAMISTRSPSKLMLSLKR